MNNPRYFTKSRFKLAVECPTKLFYTGKDALYRNLKQEDVFLKALANGGFQVGKMATMLYPDGIEITARSNTESEQQTRELLSQYENITLFEPAIRFENLFVRIDILVKRGAHFQLIEVKAKSYNSENPKISGKKTTIHAEMLPYIQDVAFQRFVLQLAYPQAKISCFLMMPDKAAKTQVDGLNQIFRIHKTDVATEIIVKQNSEEAIYRSQNILAKVPVDPYVESVFRDGIRVGGSRRNVPFEGVVRELSEAYRQDRKLPPVLKKNCSICEFREVTNGLKRSGFHECISEVTKMSREEVDSGTVLDIWHFLKKDDLLEQGRYRYSDVTEADIPLIPGVDGLSRSERQWMQIRGIPRNKTFNSFYFDREFIQRRMGLWRYPYHFIDFETCVPALPFFSGMRPYETIAFQYSHHIMERDGRVSHVGQFLMADPGRFPNIEFTRELKRELVSDQGTIFSWGSHENTVLSQILKQLLESVNTQPDSQDLVSFIQSITRGGAREMVDLSILAERAYFHPDTQGRVSIKRVLPSVLNTSSYLRNKYSQPIYGFDIPSKNFSRIAWYERTGGRLKNPYEKLKELNQQIIGDRADDLAVAESLGIDINIAEGGAASAGYSRLQFEEISSETRVSIEKALLRYCELDSLAMVMIVEAWKDWSE